MIVFDINQSRICHSTGGGPAVAWISTPRCFDGNKCGPWTFLFESGLAGEQQDHQLSNQPASQRWAGQCRGMNTLHGG